MGLGELFDGIVREIGRTDSVQAMRAQDKNLNILFRGSESRCKKDILNSKEFNKIIRQAILLPVLVPCSSARRLLAVSLYFAKTMKKPKLPNNDYDNNKRKSPLRNLQRADFLFSSEVKPSDDYYADDDKRRAEFVPDFKQILPMVAEHDARPKD